MEPTKYYLISRFTFDPPQEKGEAIFIIEDDLFLLWFKNDMTYTFSSEGAEYVVIDAFTDKQKALDACQELTRYNDRQEEMH